MLEIPLWYGLAPYALVLLGTGIFMFFNVYHVAKFGISSFATMMLLSAYVIGYLAVLVFSAGLISQYLWSSTVTVGDIFPFLGDPSSYGL